jgi:hypothetical protein
MRPNSFKVGQTVKKIETDGSLVGRAMTVIGVRKHAVWCLVNYDCPGFSPSFFTYGANELESVRAKKASSQ